MMQHFIDNEYYGTVSVSDEAFVWVVMDSYYSKWKEETENKKPGAALGFTRTAGKRQKDFEKYIVRLREARSAPNAEKWSEKLVLAAEKVRLENQQNSGNDDSGDPSDDESEPGVAETQNNAYVNQALADLGGFSDEEEEEEDSQATETEPGE